MGERRYYERMLEERIRQEDICNPKYHKITWCKDYNSGECKKTCYYARQQEKPK